MVVMSQSVIESGKGFVVRDRGRATEVRLVDVESIQGTKVDKITFDENFLVLRTNSGQGVEIGELATGFASLEDALCKIFPSFPKDWKARVDELPEGEFLTLWSVTSS